MYYIYIPYIPELSKCQHNSANMRLVYSTCHCQSKAGPYGWAHAELDEVREFLKQELAAGRFRLMSALPW